MIDLEDLLFAIFDALRRRHVPLGVDAYVLALTTITLGMQEADIETIKDVCRLLWAKSTEDQALFDETFAIEAAKQQQKAEAQQRKQQHTEHQSSLPSSTTPAPPIAVRPTREYSSVPEQQLQPQPPVVPAEHSRPSGTPSAHNSRPRRMVTYHLTPRPPLGSRDMAGIWRKLRRLQREGVSQELDVQATTEMLAHTGFLLHPVLQARRRNQARLLVLLDQGGSMEPFALFLHALLESIVRSGSLKQVDTFYFHDAPEQYLYRSPQLLGATAVDHVLAEHGQNTSVLLLSDAGAARGRYDSQRLRTTLAFLETLRRYTYLYAWLNPVPRERWSGSTAGHIAQHVPMFPGDWEGLNDLVSVLRGQVITGGQS